MADDKIAVDFLSLGDFQAHIQPRLDEAVAALRTLSTTPGKDRPALGGFQDAQEVADRYEVLRDQYLVRMSRLFDALHLAQTGTEGILAQFKDAELLNQATIAQIGSAVGAVSEALDGGRRHG